MDAEGFTLVMRPSTRQHHSPRNITGEMRDQNPFATLQDWNIRGLNWPNKQEDVKIFLHEKQIGLVGLLETKVKEKNVEKLNTKGRIWVAWRPCQYVVHIISMDEQFIHCKLAQEGQRRLLWEALNAIATDMEEAWYILGDFNSVLHPSDTIGGTDIQVAEIKPFEECMNTYEIQGMRSIGPYFTWTNKTIWTRINRTFVNTLWYEQFDFSQVIYTANSLSDHTALIIDTLS
ncbi:hypothetical protein Cgig2_014495 [Carnegiea gigantea]|uniref:Endonuclease/exonuclease/phosphatase domain-containing protein n=1 Tax=Carnegiea gigantea TaxID=171969 RepID=A0A9Q1Q9I5_9CARY|nr:hypothetical protein Cgig2_014495 [Carnegiea gigantea]